jgi:hypothetical protein
MNKRDFIKILGGGMVVAATPGCTVLQPTPSRALAPWYKAGGGYTEPRMRALSYAILCPNPHNRQPWQVDLSIKDEVALYVDPKRQLPETDPFSRQITIGLGCFLELMTMAAAADGWAVSITAFPEGYANDRPLDARPIAVARFSRNTTLHADPLFASVMDRRSLKEPFDVSQAVPTEVLEVAKSATRHGSRVDASNDESVVETLRTLTGEALEIEIDTPRTYKESVDLFRIGKREVETNPDGIDFSGRLFETMRVLRLFTRESALDTTTSSYQQGRQAVLDNTKTAMAHLWVVTATNTRIDQLNAGRDWMRIHLATTPTGIGMQPLSQALQEYPEMQNHYRRVHDLLAPKGGTVQMLARLGYGESVAPSPRWSLEAILARRASESA